MAMTRTQIVMKWMLDLLTPCVQYDRNYIELIRQREYSDDNTDMKQFWSHVIIIYTVLLSFVSFFIWGTTLTILLLLWLNRIWLIVVVFGGVLVYATMRFVACILIYIIYRLQLRQYQSGKKVHDDPLSYSLYLYNNILY